MRCDKQILLEGHLSCRKRELVQEEKSWCWRRKEVFGEVFESFQSGIRKLQYESATTVNDK